MLSANRKGQMSLEMVIGLIILLVVAGVVISLLLHYLSPERMPSAEEPMEKREFKTKCDTYCKDFATLDYCKYYFEGDDWNSNGIKDELIKVGGKAEWDVCEDKVYCFLSVPCERFGGNPIEGCVKQLCTAYKTKYGGNLTLASEAVYKMIIATEDQGCNSSLNALPSYDNWKTSYFNRSYGTETLCEHWID